MEEIEDTLTRKVIIEKYNCVVVSVKNLVGRFQVRTINKSLSSFLFYKDSNYALNYQHFYFIVAVRSHKQSEKEMIDCIVEKKYCKILSKTF